jgi:hypothetical protein
MLFRYKEEEKKMFEDETQVSAKQFPHHARFVVSPKPQISKV